jgi:hypothetical protein
LTAVLKHKVKPKMASKGGRKIFLIGLFLRKNGAELI